VIIDQTSTYQAGVSFALVIGVLGFIALAPLRQRMLPVAFDDASHHQGGETTAKSRRAASE
jgi:hypothetical protein